MDFDKIKPAIESIELSEKQKEDIINACKGRKKKFNYKPLATVAAVVVVTFVFFGINGTLFGAKMADTAENASMNSGDYFYAAEEDCYDILADMPDEDIKTSAVQSTSGTVSLKPIYYIIPAVFSDLVDKAEFEEWCSTASTENGMMMMQFVEHFGIEKSDFEKANENYALELEKIYGEPASVNPEKGKEYLEIFNSDIIYSFDRNVVDGYYLSK